MFRYKEFMYKVGFLGIITLALTAEGWGDLLCRFILGL